MLQYLVVLTIIKGNYPVVNLGRSAKVRFVENPEVEILEYFAYYVVQKSSYNSQQLFTFDTAR